MNKKEILDVFELSKLTILLGKIEKDVPKEILVRLRSKIDALRAGIDPEILAIFDKAAANDKVES